MLKAATLLAAFALLGGLARLLQEAVIAWKYGVGEPVDTYYLLATAFGWLPMVAASVLPTLLVPSEARLSKHGRGGVALFRAEALSVVLLVSFAAWIITMLGLLAREHVDAIRLRTQVPAGLEALVGLLALLLPLGLLAALFTAWLVASRRHAGTLVEALPPLCLVGLLAGGATTTPARLFGATAAAALLQVLLLAWLLRREIPRPRLSLASPEWRTVRRAAAPLFVGQACIAASIPIDNFFATSVEGGVSVLTYANRLITGGLAILGLAIYRAALPVLAARYAASDEAGRGAMLRWLPASLAIGTAGALGAALMAGPIIEAVYERGVFAVADTTRVVDAFRIGLMQTPSYLAGMILAMAIAAQDRQHVIAIAGLLALGVKFASNYLLAPVYGVNGIQVGTVLMHACTTLYLYVATRSRPASSHGW